MLKGTQNWQELKENNIIAADWQKHQAFMPLVASELIGGDHLEAKIRFHTEGKMPQRSLKSAGDRVMVNEDVRNPEATVCH